ncbi:hypothetical protein [Porphyrobacter sp. TH134]|nr:hypothetical protein [Porphyrobacter sp. TH134]
MAIRLGIENESAKNGDWWEIDLIIVTLLGFTLVGTAAFYFLFTP